MRDSGPAYGYGHLPRTHVPRYIQRPPKRNSSWPDLSSDPATKRARDPTLACVPTPDARKTKATTYKIA